MSKASEMRATIKAARDFSRVPVSVPEWGLPEGLFVRSLSIADAVAFERSNESLPPERTAAVYLAYTLCDEDGERVFDPAADLDELLSKSAEVINRLFDAGLHLNNGDPAAPEALGESLPSPSYAKPSSWPSGWAG
jgi:hypothetical protein